MNRVLLIRHCQSNAIPEPDDCLTPLGFEQAAALAEYLAGFDIDRVICSTFQRARQTIAPFVAASGLPLELDERVTERRLSVKSFPTEEQWLGFVRASLADLSLRAEGGESGHEALQRGWAALEEALAAEAELPALVSHGQLITLLLTKIDPAFGFEGWRAMTNPDVFIVEPTAQGRLAFKRAWS